MAATPVFTYQDMVEWLWEVFNPSVKPPTGRELRVAKMAVIRSYRDLANRHDWNYYKRLGHIVTDASYTTGTVTYDHTGGTYERELTLATGTWPTNSARGVVVIANNHYPVEERKSDTVVTLGPSVNPGADVAAGTSYTWYRDSYQLPTDFRRMLSIIESSSGGDVNPLTYVEPGTHRYVTRYESGPVTSDPDWYTIRNTGDYYGTMCLVFGLAPNSAKTYDIMYQVQPRGLRIYKDATGTVTVAAGSTSVSGSTTAFTSYHEGSIMRFTDSGTIEPTNMWGNVSGDTNPYISQRTVLSVTSAALLTLDAAVSTTATLTAKKYTLSDPIDIEPITMRSALESLCMAHFASLTKRKDASVMQRDAEREILMAMEQDRRTNVVDTGELKYDVWSSGNWGEVDVVPT